MTEDEQKQSEDEPQVCEKCGSKLIEEEGDLLCPKCDGEIDYFGDGEDE